jgi:hypothetical protein
MYLEGENPESKDLEGINLIYDIFQERADIGL